MKNKRVALILCFFTGLFGGHHYYLGNWRKGILRFILTCMSIITLITIIVSGGNELISLIFLSLVVVDFFRILFDANYINNYKTMNFKEDMKESIKEELTRREGKREMKYNPKREEQRVCCPKCGSTSLSANKKGFGLLKGAAGVLTFGAYGVVTAGIGKNKIIITCLACGKQFKPGK